MTASPKRCLDASNDDDVAAIVFRVNSPGGSVVASDQILAALRTARSAARKSSSRWAMSQLPAATMSSAYADEIIAEPDHAHRLYRRARRQARHRPGDGLLSVDQHRAISVGSPVIGMFSSNRPFNQAERAAFAGFIDRAYARLHRSRR